MTRIVENGVHVGPLPQHRTKVPPRPAAGPVGPEIVVNGQVISRAEIEAEAQHHPAANPGLALEAAARALTVRALLLQQARRSELSPEPERLDDTRRETEEEALIRQLLEAEVEVPDADEATCQRYFTNNRQRFSSPALYEAKHILIVAKADDDDARKTAKQKAAAVLATVQQDPAGFGGLAKSWSDCPSAAQGGNLGQLGKGQTVQEFEDVLFEMQPGTIWPEPVVTRFGAHIIALDRIIEGRELPFEVVRERIGAYLEASSWSRAIAQYISLLAGAADIRGIELDAAASPLVQ